ncbi:MAG TPA: chemotaxis protein CheX [Anaeromyxobacteraceae bacterium]|nr:chemotaxis protein CheX [Anaeromyxobacteraceae bacterium]
MNSLPPPAQMAAVVSGVTETMLGLTFAPCTDGTPWTDLVWRAAVLPIPGARPLMVGLSSDRPGCTALGAKMFSVAESEVSDDMLSDSLCELVNMTAGLLKSELALDQQLGLPKIVAAGQPPVPSPPTPAHSVVLRARERVGLVLWIFEGLA